MDSIPIVSIIAVFLIPLTAILGGFVFLIVRTMARTRMRELEIRERIAMIERGMVPPPEVDPKGFDRAMLMHEYVVARRTPAQFRHRRAGITLMGVGFGLMVLIAFTGDVQAGVGVGGFLVILGFAFFINSLFEGPQNQLPSPGYPASPPSPLSSPLPAPPATPAAQPPNASSSDQRLGGQ